ncbi:hypothetical protein FH5_02230 [Priestia endophytica]|nr:hypothetical protein FH5_02230 [Priestia endophytica]
MYRIALNKFNELVQTADKKDNEESVVVTPRKIVRKEMLPDWFQEHQEKEKEKVKESTLFINDESQEDEIARMKAILAHYS